MDTISDWSISDGERSRWFEGKVFLHPDYVSRNADPWMRALSPLRERPAEVLEIGTLEGRSALFFLNFLPRSRITCIDPFPQDRERIFDANLGALAGRVEKLKSFSLPALIRLRNAARKFDVIYIDGDHNREAVALDCFSAGRCCGWAASSSGTTIASTRTNPRPRGRARRSTDFWPPTLASSRSCIAHGS